MRTVTSRIVVLGMVVRSLLGGKITIGHSHIVHEGQAPKCPGLDSTITYQPKKTGGWNADDYEQHVINNVARRLALGPDAPLLATFIIDLDYAWYIPWDGALGGANVQSISRRAGAGGIGCKWF